MRRQRHSIYAVGVSQARGSGTSDWENREGKRVGNDVIGSSSRIQVERDKVYGRIN